MEGHGQACGPFYLMQLHRRKPWPLLTAKRRKLLLQIRDLMRGGLQPRLIMEELLRMGWHRSYTTVQDYCYDARYFFPDLPISRSGRLSGKNYHLPSMQSKRPNHSKTGPAEQ